MPMQIQLEKRTGIWAWICTQEAPNLGDFALTGANLFLGVYRIVPKMNDRCFIWSETKFDIRFTL